MCDNLANYFDIEDEGLSVGRRTFKQMKNRKAISSDNIHEDVLKATRTSNLTEISI